MKIYIDITNVIQVDFLTGIQRVVRNVVIEMLRCQMEKVVLLAYQRERNVFSTINGDWFLRRYGSDCIEEELRKPILTNAVRLEDFCAGDIFFDIDSVWNTDMQRSTWLPALKAHGVRTAVFVHDIIPVRRPSFFPAHTLYRFLDYIGAYMQHGDCVITSTKSVLDDVRRLADELGVQQVNGDFSWLGSGFSENVENRKVEPAVRRCLKNKRYILCVGTIEPRKNLDFILDAFENELFAENICLVFAGRMGWNIESLRKRIEKHPLRGSKFFYFSGLNDDTIDELYHHALALAFPTWDEGFGLPMVEAFERKTPVIASDIPVLREVGGDMADYFPHGDERTLCKLIRKYATDDEWRNRRIQNIEKNYIRYTWKDTTKKILHILETLNPPNAIVSDHVRQMVMLTARADAVGATLQYIDAYMPFIEEVVLCCPDNKAEEMQNSYQGRLKLRVLTDSEVLDGRELPEDHVVRNTFLRACAILGDKLDDVFIMSDDDYRPLHKIDKSLFVADGKYHGYYCYDLEYWEGVGNSLTPYDRGMKRTAQFLADNGLPTRQYSSHMPQIIDRRIYVELLTKYPDAMTGGYDEWSLYFNYLQAIYPNQMEARIYQTVAWPGRMTNWRMRYLPSEWSFENYYEDLYEKGEIFEGLSQAFDAGDTESAQQKIALWQEEVQKYQNYRVIYETYCREYELEYGERPSFGVSIHEDQIQIFVPRYVTLPVGGFERVPFFMLTDAEHKGTELSIKYALTDGGRNVFWGWETQIVETDGAPYRLPLFGKKERGYCILELLISVGRNTGKAAVKVKNI